MNTTHFGSRDIAACGARACRVHATTVAEMVDCSRCQKTADYKAAMVARPAPRSSEALSWVKGDVIRTPGGDLMLVNRDTFSNSWVGTWLADGKVARLYDDHPWVRDGRVQLVASGEKQVKYGGTFEENGKHPTPAQVEVLARLAESPGVLLERWPGGFWTLQGMRLNERDAPEWSTLLHTVRAMELRGWLRRAHVYPEDWRDSRELTEAGREVVTPAHRRYSVNARDSVAAAREIRRKFHDKEAEKETPVPWDWPEELQEIGTCEAVMYASSKWQKNPHKIIDYKHVAEGPQRILVRPGFVQDHRGNKALKVVGPRHELNDMPDAFAVLDKILGVQVRLYKGTDEDPQMPPGDDGYYQIDIPGAYLGAAKHPETGETFLIVYTNDGVHCLIVGEQLDVEKDGIVG